VKRQPLLGQTKRMMMPKRRMTVMMLMLMMKMRVSESG
jgi:hypothetical protein